jgi:predicted restriction endonuclease
MSEDAHQLRGDQLRAAAIERDGHRCRFPTCELPLTAVNPLEMAHLHGKQMGGSRYRNVIDNVVMLCKHHHDWLDGRLISGRQHENEILLRDATGIHWEDRR